MFSARLVTSTPHSSLRLLSSRYSLQSSSLSRHTLPLSAIPSSHPLLLSHGNVRTMGFWKELQKSLADEIAKEKKDLQSELQKEMGEPKENQENKEQKEGTPKEEEPQQEQGPSLKEKLNETIFSTRQKMDEYMAQAREKAQVAKDDFTKKYEQYRAPPPESSSTTEETPSTSASTSSSEGASGEEKSEDTTVGKKSQFDEWRETMSASFASGQKATSENEQMKTIMTQYHQAREWGKGMTGQLDSFFKKGIEENEKTLEAAKKQLKDSTITKQFESAASSAKKTTHDTSSIVTDWMSQRSEEISTTISDSEVGKKTIKAKEHIEKFVMDPQPAQRAGPGPIIADDEMKAMVEKEEALWRKQVRDLKGKVEDTKAYKAISDAKIAIEDSDNPLVQRSLDVVDTISLKAEKVGSMVLGSSEEAEVLAAIDQYIPGFTIEEFLQDIIEHEGTVYTFLKAATARDFETLTKMSTELNLKRHELIAEKTADEIPPGTTPNLVITWIDLPELMQLSFNDSNDNPQILMNFNVQCYTEYLDANGKAELPETISSLKYLWLLQYDPQYGWLVHEDAVGAREAIW